MLIAVGGTKLSVGDTSGCLQAWRDSRTAFEHVLQLQPDDAKATARLNFLLKRMP